MIFLHKFWGTALSPMAHSGVFFSYAAERFLSDILLHSLLSISSAYPANRTVCYTPFKMLFIWNSTAEDTIFYDAIRKSMNQIWDVAFREGQDILNAPRYLNYALFDTPLQEIYGENLEKLRHLKQRVDPEDIMGLVGGFKF